MCVNSIKLLKRKRKRKQYFKRNFEVILKRKKMKIFFSQINETMEQYEQPFWTSSLRSNFTSISEVIRIVKTEVFTYIHTCSLADFSGEHIFINSFELSS